MNRERIMKRSVLAAATLLLFCGFVPSKIGAQLRPGDSGTCWAESRDKNQPFRKKLWDGYELSLGPVPNPEAEESCTAAIYRADGKVVYRTTGFNVQFDAEHTGMDFDGDGKGEVVLRTDTGGGMHCCWEMNVISVSPRVHKLFDLPGYPRVERDPQGKIVIWTLLAGPYGYTSNAAAPGAQKAWRVKNGKLVDATPEFCPRLSASGTEQQDDWQHPDALSPEALENFRKTGAGPWENEATISALLSRALQYLVCGEPAKALADLELWPEKDRHKMKADFAAVVRADYQAFAEQIAGPAKAAKP
jgi:hypothetical protein